MENTTLTPQEVADILKITKNTVYELIKRGELNAYRAGKKIRVDLADVEEYKNKSRSTPSVPAVTDYHEAPPLELSATMYEYPTDRGFIICGQDMLLDILSRYLEQHPKGTRALRSYVGSYNGLYALYRGDVQLATAHIWDGDTNTYNLPYVRRMLPGVPALIVNLATRVQGFYVAKGNPLGIRGWEDLRRTDLTIVNREKGSGTRILLDERLRLMHISGKTLKGYDRECLSHLAVASTVARGGADIGIGNEKTALQVTGVDFIPLQEEPYDMVIKKEDMDKPVYEAILEIVRSKEFQLELMGIGGHDFSKTGHIVGET